MQKQVENRLLEASLHDAKASLLKKSPAGPDTSLQSATPFNFKPDLDPPDVSDAPFLQTLFDQGFLLQSEDKAFSLHVGTLVQFSNGWYSAPDNIQQTLDRPLVDGSDLRRMRLRLDGNIFSQFIFMMEFDVSGGADFRTPLPDPQAPLFINQV